VRREALLATSTTGNGASAADLKFLHHECRQPAPTSRTIFQRENKMMSTIYSAPAARSMAGWQFSVLATLRQWYATYTGWRVERAAIAHLCTMNDRELRDIGLLRSQLAQSVPDVTWAHTIA
jgi:uncharacterized protein YjiS (DUF1127 family)